jgi:hypothetical protein
MSFLYPRTIAITRPTQAGTVGAVGYGGQVPSTEEPVADGIAASIQLKKDGRSPRAALPGDAHLTEWRIMFKGARDLVQARDVITDDLGVRYQVQAPYWNSLGFNCLCERLGT